MKIYKVFEVREIEDALEAVRIASNSFWDCIDNFCNDVAVPWLVENPYEDDPFLELTEGRKVINKYLISQGCSIDEIVYIDVSW